MEESYTGHRAEDDRYQLHGNSAAQQEEWLHDRVIRLFPDAEVTAIKLENVDDPAQELRASYHLQAPRYAQATGRRILFQSSPFRRGQASPFTASERRFPVEFPYAWQEVDQIHIRLPEGWSLDNADNPGSMDFGQVGAYEMKMTISKDNDLFTSRQLVFGRGGALYFPPQNYAVVKKVFDEIQLRDGHTISITERK